MDIRLVWPAALFIALGLMACANPTSEQEFNGTPLKSGDIAPNFALSDQADRSVSLESLKGQVVVLTFLYTNCPDVCPIVTSRLREVQMLLETDADDARFVAVSVDPDRDTVGSAQEYLDRWGLSANWHFLVGDRPELEEVWKAYYVDPAVSDHDPLESGQASPTPEPRGAIDALSAEIEKRYLVIHSTPVFLIDREGRRRVVFTPPLEPEEVAADIRRLLDSG
ncbi:MAG: SCO family protein [Dehalococcoidia bacterium]|nr:SCO family protein [Dehalococcoidia bacterium]